MMDKSILNKIEDLIKDKKINQAQIEISKLGPEFHKDIEYLFLRGKIFYINKLYYQALDALLIATEFGEDGKVYDLISRKGLSPMVSNSLTGGCLAVVSSLIPSLLCVLDYFQFIVFFDWFSIFLIQFFLLSLLTFVVTVIPQRFQRR